MNFKIQLFIIVIILTSCISKREDYAIILPGNDTVNIKSINWNHHENAPGKTVTNLYIELESYTKITNLEKPEIKLKFGDSIYSAKGIKLFFSREYQDTDFIYFYHNQTKKVVIDTIDNRRMILIWPEKTNFENLPKNLQINNLYSR